MGIFININLQPNKESKKKPYYIDRTGGVEELKNTEVGEPFIYEVMEGDELEDIAEMFGVNKKEILMLNMQDNEFEGALDQPGFELKIPYHFKRTK